MSLGRIVETVNRDALYFDIGRFVQMEDRKRALVSRLLQYALVNEVLAIPYDEIIIKRTLEGKPYLVCMIKLASSCFIQMKLVLMETQICIEVTESGINILFCILCISSNCVFTRNDFTSFSWRNSCTFLACTSTINILFTTLCIMSLFSGMWWCLRRFSQF